MMELLIVQRVVIFAAIISNQRLIMLFESECLTVGRFKWSFDDGIESWCEFFVLLFYFVFNGFVYMNWQYDGVIFSGLFYFLIHSSRFDDGSFKPFRAQERSDG